MNSVAEICAALKEITRCTIMMHHRPDGDTVGSAAALGMALRQLGKEVQYACADPITPRYADLVNGAEHFAKPEGTLIAVDIAAPDMAGRFKEYAAAADIVIDHHESNVGYGKLNLIRPEAAAAGEIMYDVVCGLVPLSQDIAKALYVAVSTDTGCFLHGSTTANTHRVAAALMETGFDIKTVNRPLFVLKSKAAILIRSKLTDSMETFAEDSLAVLTLTLEDIASVGATEDDMENLAAAGMQVMGIRSAATLRQVGEQEYKASVRSDGSVNAADICKVFGGGGHAMAAGCTLFGSLAHCKQEIKKVMTEMSR